MVRNFGGVPLVLGLKLPSEITGIKRATVEDTYAQIEKDLLEAIPDLPKRSEYDAMDLGRATKGAAQGYLAKAYLYQGKYTEAEPLLQEITCRGEFAGGREEYELLSDFGQVWDIDQRNSTESLFEVQTNSDVSYNLGIRIPIVCGSRDDSGWAWGLPTSNLERAFQEEKPVRETPEEQLNEDYRLRWTIIKNGATKVYGDANAKNPYVISPNDHKSPRVSRKLYIPVEKRPTPYDAPHIPLNYRLLRYADVLLMYAEVENELGHDDEAKWALNKVRDRVYLAPSTATGTELRNAIRKERRLNWRWKITVCMICAVGKMIMVNRLFVMLWDRMVHLLPIIRLVMIRMKAVTKKRIVIKVSISRRVEMNFFPLPPTEITLSGGSIEQNPGY